MRVLLNNGQIDQFDGYNRNLKKLKYSALAIIVNGDVKFGSCLKDYY